jgi:Domain of unknown function (DUF5348)
VSVRRIEHQDGQVTYYLHMEYGYGDTMEVTPKDMMALGAWLLEHEQVVVEDAIRNDVLQAQQEIESVVDGMMDYGAGRYQIAGDSLEVYHNGRWVPARIEADNGGWLFLWPLDATAPSDVYGLPVRRAAG